MNILQTRHNRRANGRKQLFPSRKQLVSTEETTCFPGGNYQFQAWGKSLTRYMTILLLLCGGVNATVAQTVTYQYIVGKDITSAPTAGSTTQVGPVKITWGSATAAQDNSSVSRAVNWSVYSNRSISTAPFADAKYIKGDLKPRNGQTDNPSASAPPTTGGYFQFDFTESGTFTIALENDKGSGNPVQMIDGTAKTMTSTGLEADGVYTTNVVAGHTYYFCITGGSYGFGLYGFTFTKSLAPSPTTIADFKAAYATLHNGGTTDYYDATNDLYKKTINRDPTDSEASSTDKSPSIIENESGNLFSALTFGASAANREYNVSNGRWVKFNSNGMFVNGGGELYVTIDKAYIPTGSTITITIYASSNNRTFKVYHNSATFNSSKSTLTGGSWNASGDIWTWNSGSTVYSQVISYTSVGENMKFQIGNGVYMSDITVTPPPGENLLSFSTERVTKSLGDDITSADYPTLTNETGSDVTYESTDESVVKVLGGNGGTSYRIVGPGFAVVTATAGDYQAACNFVITDKEGAGEYDGTTQKYTFTETGRLTEKTITNSEGLALTIGNGTETVVVVERDSRKGAKVIDGNGYFFRYKADGAVLPSMGTFYQLVVTDTWGTFSATANVTSTTVLTDDSGTSVGLTTEGNTLKTTSGLKPGTYYLYNDDTDDNQPLLLYDFSFVPTAQEWSSSHFACYFGDDVSTKKPTLLRSEGKTITYSSSNTDVARFANPNDYSTLVILTTGTTTITAIGSDGIPVSYTMTITPKTWKIRESHPDNQTLAEEFEGKTFDTTTYWNRKPENNPSISYQPTVTKNEFIKVYASDSEQLFEGLQFSMTNNGNTGWLIHYTGVGFTITTNSSQQLVKIEKGYLPQGTTFKVYYTSYGSSTGGISVVSGADYTDGNLSLSTSADNEAVTFVAVGDEGAVIAIDRNIGLSKIEILDIEPLEFKWKATENSYPLVEINDDNTPANMSKMVELKRNIDNTATVTYSSSEPSVAAFKDPTDYSSLQLKKVGTTMITATMTDSHGLLHTSSYTLTLTGTEQTVTDNPDTESTEGFGTWTSADNTFTFIAEGWTNDVEYENADFKGGGVIGLTATVGATGETHLIQAKSNSGNVFDYSIKSIDGDGKSTVTLNNGIPTSGSFMKFEATVEGAVLTASGTFSPSETVLIRVSNGGNARGRAKTRAGAPEEVDIIFTDNDTRITSNQPLEVGYSYYLYNRTTTMYIHSFGSSPKLVAGGDKYDLHGVEKGMVIELVVSAVTDDGTAGTSELTITQALATTHPVGGVNQTIITYAVTDEEIGDAESPNTVFIRVPLPQEGETNNDVIIHSARAFYKEPQLKLNYTPQAIYNHRENWTDENLKTHYADNVGIKEAFDLAGLPTFTALMHNDNYTADFEPLSDGSGFTVTSKLELRGTNGTVRSNGNGSAITEGTVSVPVRLNAVARGYAAGTDYTATITLPIIPFPYTWDFTSGISGKTTALILENVEDGATYMTLGPSSVENAETRYVDVGGGQTRERTSYNYSLDPELPNSRLSIPVMEGMQVNITFAPSAKERTTGNGYPMEISNVTDLYGNATAEVSILTEENTQSFIASANGYVEIYNRSDVEVYIKKIEVTAPRLEFEDGTEPEVSWNATYQNRVINQPIGSTLDYKKTDASGIVKTMTTDGTFTFNDHTTGTVTVTATVSGAKGLEPAWGEYTIRVRDFTFNEGTVEKDITGTTTFKSSDLNSLLLDGNAITAADLSKVSFSCSSPALYNGNTNNAKGVLIQTTDGYTLEVRNDGQLVITATYRQETGKISTLKTSFVLNIINNKADGFKYPAPIIEAATTGNTTYDFNTQNTFTKPTTVTSVKYEAEPISKDGTITASISETTLAISGPGVVHVKALNNDIGENQGNLLDEFYLTVAYPVNETTSQSWDFTGGLHDKDGHALSTTDTENWAAGMPPTTNRGNEMRYLKEVNGDNAFIVKETAGLQIIASEPANLTDATQGHFSVGTNSSYPNIGLHQSTLIIPQLKKGQYVAVAWDRIDDNVGNTMEVSNLLDLEGKVIDEIKYGGSVNLTGGNAGKPQGYYTFRVAEDGNVSFTQNDNGTSRIVAIHVYHGDANTSINAENDINYNSNSSEPFRGSGMTETLISNTNRSTGALDLSSALRLDGTFLIDGDHTTTQRLARYLAFNAPNGQPEFKMVDQDESIKGMTIDMSNEFYDSGNGMYAIPGLTFHGGWGKGVMSIGVRDNNGYLVAYRQYRFTVGQKPHQTYPKTWDFTRYFDNSTVKVADSEVSSEAPAGLDTKSSLATNSTYARVTTNTDPTQTWASGNKLLRSSENDGETASYKQYGKNDYSSYYVDNAVLVCNQGERNVNGFIIPETNGLGFNISNAGNSLQWQMPTDGAGYKGTSYLEFGGTMTLGSVNDADHYGDYYVFVNSSDSPTAGDNLEALPDGDDYEDITGTGQYAFHVSGNGDMTLSFPSATKIYAIGVTNIKKDAIHPVGGIGWATESRSVNINHTLTGTFTRHDLKAYEVKYEEYDLESATVALTEITDTKEQTDALSATFTDIGYVPAGTGIVLRQDETDETEPYPVPFFTPALTTTQPVSISTGNMMRPNIVRTEFRTEEEIDASNNHFTRFLLTNINWLFTKGGDLAEEESVSRTAPAAGFYRMHQFTAYTDDQNELARQNTLKANTAFMAVPADQLPIAIWNLTDDDTPLSGSRRNKIAIRNGSRADATGIEEIDFSARRTVEGGEAAEGSEQWYTMSGQRIERPRRPGLYIFNGRKVVVR